MLLAGGGILNVFRLFAGEDILFAVHFLLPEEKTLLSVEKILLRIPCPKTISLSLSQLRRASPQVRLLVISPFSC